MQPCRIRGRSLSGRQFVGGARCPASQVGAGWCRRWTACWLRDRCGRCRVVVLLAYSPSTASSEPTKIQSHELGPHTAIGLARGFELPRVDSGGSRANSILPCRDVLNVSNFLFNVLASRLLGPFCLRVATALRWGKSLVLSDELVTAAGEAAVLPTQSLLSRGEDARRSGPQALISTHEGAYLCRLIVIFDAVLPVRRQCLQAAHASAHGFAAVSAASRGLSATLPSPLLRTKSPLTRVAYAFAMTRRVRSEDHLHATGCTAAGSTILGEPQGRSGIFDSTTLLPQFDDNIEAHWVAIRTGKDPTSHYDTARRACTRCRSSITSRFDQLLWLPKRTSTMTAPVRCSTPRHQPAPDTRILQRQSSTGLSSPRRSEHRRGARQANRPRGNSAGRVRS